jgi:hypothetical protein
MSSQEIVSAKENIRFFRQLRFVRDNVYTYEEIGDKTTILLNGAISTADLCDRSTFEICRHAFGDGTEVRVRAMLSPLCQRGRYT